MSIRQGNNIIAGSTNCTNYRPDLFDYKWSDHILYNVQWLRADTFSWQSGSVYEAAYNHLANDISGISSTSSETVAGTTITFYLAADGHKICLPDQLNNIEAIYAATDVAWYYVIDTTNQRFKLPRSKHNKYSATLGVIGNGKNMVYTDGTNDCVQNAYFGTSNNGVYIDKKASNVAVNVGTGLGNATNITEHTAIGLSQDASKSGVIAQQEQDTDQYKYLYFYVGNFTQTALENAAGITAETLNDKVDKGHHVIEFQAPTAANNYTWYRKYADGWVEQGGILTGRLGTITLSVEMADANYCITFTGCFTTNPTSSSAEINPYAKDITTTSIYLYTNRADKLTWRVEGMAAS